MGRSFSFPETIISEPVFQKLDDDNDDDSDFTDPTGLIDDNSYISSDNWEYYIKKKDVEGTKREEAEENKGPQVDMQSTASVTSFLSQLVLDRLSIQAEKGQKSSQSNDKADCHMKAPDLIPQQLPHDDGNQIAQAKNHADDSLVTTDLLLATTVVFTCITGFATWFSVCVYDDICTP